MCRQGFVIPWYLPLRSIVKRPLSIGGENVMDTFMDCMFKESNEEIVAVPKSLSVDEQDQFRVAVDCNICGEVLGADRVREWKI